MSEITVERLVCANHPNRETTLRCNRCEKPICPDCAVLTPTGYRCAECVRSQQRIFETAQWYDYPLAFVVASGLTFIGSLIATRLGFFTLFLAPAAGAGIAELVRRVVRRRRGARLLRITAVAAAVGSLPTFLVLLVGLVGRGGLVGLLPLVWQGYYAFAVISTIYYRMGGIRL